MQEESFAPEEVPPKGEEVQQEFPPSQESFEQLEERRKAYLEKNGPPGDPNRSVETLLKEISQLEISPEDREVMLATFYEGRVDLGALDLVRPSARALVYAQTLWLNFIQTQARSKKEKEKNKTKADVELDQGKDLRKKLLQRLDVVAGHYPALLSLLEAIRQGITRIDVGLDLERIVATYNDEEWRPRIEEHIVRPQKLLDEVLVLAQKLQLPDPKDPTSQQQQELKALRDLQFAITLGMLEEIRDMGRFIHRRSPLEKRRPYRDMYQVWRRKSAQEQIPQDN